MHERLIDPLEKALLDSLDAPALAGPMPVVVAALDQAAREGRLDSERLVAYAIRMGGPVLGRRLGYFMDKLDIPGQRPAYSARQAGGSASARLGAVRSSEPPTAVFRRSVL